MRRLCRYLQVANRLQISWCGANGFPAFEAWCHIDRGPAKAYPCVGPLSFFSGGQALGFLMWATLAGLQCSCARLVALSICCCIALVPASKQETVLAGCSYIVSAGDVPEMWAALPGVHWACTHQRLGKWRSNVDTLGQPGRLACAVCPPSCSILANIMIAHCHRGTLGHQLFRSGQIDSNNFRRVDCKAAC